MNTQEIKSAINDFRKSYRDDLGARLVYGQKTSTSSGGFSIDENTSTYTWVDKTTSGDDLYCTVSVATTEELVEAGLSQKCTGIVTCIFEDILDVQPIDINGGKSISKQAILDDVILVFLNGYRQYYRIVDFSFAFQLKNTYIFMKFGVIDVKEGEIDWL